MEKDTISSEIYTEYDYITTATPLVNKDNVVSKFPFRYAATAPEVDSDGDIVVKRKPKTNNCYTDCVEIEHSKSTVLALVGHQVWRGALLLADWLLHYGQYLPKDALILELGSGVGLTSIVASIFRPVVCTDVNKGEILNLIKNNIQRNKNLVKHPITVLELDFTAKKLSSEMMLLLPNIKLILAADVIYDNELTEAFVNTVELLLSRPPKRSIYIALEKRYVFMLADCDTIAPCYEFFLECFNKLNNVDVEEISLDFQQYFQYERVKELVLWKVSSRFSEIQ